MIFKDRKRFSQTWLATFIAALYGVNRIDKTKVILYFTVK